MEQMLATARQAAPLADVLELRLDALAEPMVAPFLNALEKPLLITNRPAWEGGHFSGAENDRLAPLLEAAAAGCAYVDLELQADVGLRRELLAETARSGTALVLSWHNFDQTPDDQTLADILALQREGAATIGKIVTMAHSFQDVLRVLNLQLAAAAHNFPLIAFCMGKTGLISRLATLELGGYMTYAAPSEQGATAPGQLPIATLTTILATLRHGH